MSYPVFVPRAFPIPVVRAESLIPRGGHCYEPAAEQSGVYRTKVCPFWARLANGSGWCDYLKVGDDGEASLPLLSDQVKECDVKREIPEEWLEPLG